MEEPILALDGGAVEPPGLEPPREVTGFIGELSRSRRLPPRAEPFELLGDRALLRGQPLHLGRPLPLPRHRKERLRPLAYSLLLLGDSPTPEDDIPTCLASNLSSVGNCVSSRDNAVRPGRLAVEREVALKYDADFIPTSDWMCTDTACPVVVGNVLMYRDSSHITATASEFLSPFIETAVKSVLG